VPMLALSAKAATGRDDGEAASTQVAATAESPVSARAAACSKIWIGHEGEYETAIRTAAIEKIEDIPVGVTKPKRLYLKDGGSVRSVAWKPIRPGIHGGFWDSYLSEIASYEVDKLLHLHMVPPVVEREVRGQKGAAVLWVENVKGWKINQPVDGPDPAAWTLQIVDMKMFDNLIGNADRNQGNIFYDADYHLILIDHSRAFSTEKNLIVPLEHVDRDLWTRMDALTDEAIVAAVGKWLDGGQVRAVIARRNRMREAIAKLVKQRGEGNVFLTSSTRD
jgi:hypothetical protein